MDLQIIKINPYRVLGVFANASKKEIVANISKLQVLAKLKKNVFSSFDADFINILGEIDRSEKSIKQAQSDLTLSSDKLKYAFFWFIKQNQFDEIAFNHLKKGNLDVALNILEKGASVSSCQNSFILHVLQGCYDKAIANVEELFSTYWDEFVHLILKEESLSVNTKAALTYYINTLISLFGVDTLLEYVSNEDLRKVIVNNSSNIIIEQINENISYIKNVSSRIEEINFAYLFDIINKISSDLILLKSIVGVDSSKFIDISDIVAKEVLSLGDRISSLKNLAWKEKVLNLLGFAQRIACSSLLKSKCHESYENLKNVVDQERRYKLIEEDVELIKSYTKKSANSMNLDELKAMINLVCQFVENDNLEGRRSLLVDYFAPSFFNRLSAIAAFIVKLSVTAVEKKMGVQIIIETLQGTLSNLRVILELCNQISNYELSEDNKKAFKELSNYAEKQIYGAEKAIEQINDVTRENNSGCRGISSLIVWSIIIFIIFLILAN